MRAFVLVNVKVGNLAPVIERLRAIDGVEMACGTFGQWNAVLELNADTLMHLGEIVFNEIRTTAGVETTLTLPVVM